MIQSLEGRLILDCSALLPGPFVGKLLLQKGARVVKVENPLKPDGAKEMGTAYAELNEGKEIIALNLMDSADRARFHDWVRQADGLIEGFRPSAKKKLGLDPETLHSINPKLCIASLVGYPENGPWRDRPGHDVNFVAASGCLSLFEGMSPLPLADLFSAYEGAFSMTAALDAVARGAPGRRVVISMSETLKQVQGLLVREYRATGVTPRYGDTLFSGKYPCYRLYTCSDRRKIAVGAIEQKFWEKTCEILDIPQLKNEGYAEGFRGQEVISIVQSIFEKRTSDEWNSLFEPAECCVELVKEYPEVF